MSIYAPHPWDALPATPPAPGRDYSDALDPLPVKDALRAADLLREADDLDDQASRLEDEAEDARQEARAVLRDLREAHPALADAIEEDPSSVFDEATVRRAANPQAPGQGEALA